MKYIVKFILLSIILLYSACSVGEDTSSDSIKKTKEAYFIDSAVAGVHYSNSDGSVQGITDKDGKFQYYSDDTITFSVGDIVLGRISSVPSDNRVLPADLLNLDRTQTNNEDTIKMLVFLQSIDEDHDPSNGIEITSQTSNELSNFDQPKLLSTQTLDQVSTILNSIGEEPVSKDSAIEHYISTLKTRDIVDVKDNNPPNISIDSYYVKKDNPIIYGHIDDVSASITLELDGSIYTALVNPENGTWQNNQAIGSLSEGEHKLTVRAIDKSQNLAVLNTQIQVDSNPPLVSTSDSVYYIKNSFDTISGAINDTSASINIEINDKNYTASNLQNGTWSFSNSIFNTLAEGTYICTIYAQDKAKNISSEKFTLIVDRTAPVITLDKAYFNTQSINLSGTINEKVKLLKVSVAGVNYNATIDGDKWTIQQIDTLQNSNYQINLIAYDYAGNLASIIKNIYIQLPQNTSIVDFNNLIINEPKPELHGTVSDKDAIVKVTITKDSTTYVKDFQAKNLQDGTWIIDKDSLPVDLQDGIYNIRVSATDLAQNTYYVDRTLQIDTVVPTVSMLPVSTSNRTPTLTGTITSDTKSLAIKINNHIYTLSNNYNTTWSQTITDPLPDGTYDVDFAIIDYANNSQIVSKPASVVIDTVAPTITITSNLDTNDSTPKIEGTFDDKHDIASLVININGHDYNAVIDQTHHTWYYNVSLALDDGYYPITLTIKDAFGNTTINTNYTLRVDLLAPSITYTPIFTKDLTPAISGTISEDTILLDINISNKIYNLSNNNHNWLLADNTISPALNEGNHTFIIRAKDSFNNQSIFNSYFIVDITKPTVSINPMQSNNKMPTISGSVSDNYGATVQVQIDSTTLNTNAIVNGNTWYYTFNQDVAEGNHTITVTAIDKAGNSETNSSYLFIDSIPPNIVQVSSNPIYTNNDTNKTVVLQGEANSKLLINNLDTNLTLDENGQIVYEFNITGVDKVYDFNISLKDKFNNVSLVNDLKIIKDRVSPIKPKIITYNLDTNNYINSSSLTILVIKEANSTINLYDAKDNNKSLSIINENDINSTDANITFNIPQSSDNNISITVTDLAGNESNITSLIFSHGDVPAIPKVILNKIATNTINDVNATIYGNSGDSIYVNGNDTLFDIASDGKKTITLDTSGVDGIMNFDIALSNDAGLGSAKRVSIIKDATPPNAPTIVGLSYPFNTTTTQDYKVLQIYGEANATVCIDNSCDYKLDENGLLSYSFTTNSGDKSYIFNIYLKDKLGNQSSSIDLNITKDTTPPAKPIISDYPQYTDNSDATITVRGEVGAKVFYLRDGFSSYYNTNKVIQDDGHGDLNGSVQVNIDTTGDDGDSIRFDVVLYDALDNKSPAQTFNITIDTSIPELPTLVENSPFYTNQSTLSIDLNFTQTGEVYIDDIFNKSITATGINTITIDNYPLNSVSEHKLTIHSSSTDKYEGYLAFIIDHNNTLPKDIELNITSDYYTNKDFVNVNILAQPENKLYINNIYSGDISISGSINKELNITGTDGDYIFNFNTINKYNSSSQIKTLKIIKDTIAPISSTFTFINNSVDNNNYTNKDTVSIRVIKSEANTTIKLYDVKNNHTEVPIISQVENSPLDVNITFNIPQDTDNNISLTLTDLAGNESNDTNISQRTSIIFTKGTAPMAPIINSIDAIKKDNIYYTKDSEVQAVVYGEFNASVYVNGNDTTIDINSSNLASVGLNTEGDDGLYDFNLTLDNGDRSGQVKVQIIKDTLAPSAPSVSGLPSITSQSSLIGTVSGEVNSTLFVNGNKVGQLDENGKANYLFVLNEGDNSFNLTLKDLVGNESGVYVVNIKKDTTPPQTPTLTTTPQYTNTQTTSVEVNGEASTTILVNDQAVGTMELDGSTFIDLNTSVATDCSLGNKNIEFNIVLKDDMNLTSSPYSFTIIKDTCPPQLPKFTSYAPTHTTEDNITLDMYRNEVDVDIYINGIKSSWTTQNGNYASYTFDTSLPEGSKNFSVTYIDKAGNQSPALDYSIYRDNTPLYIVSAVYNDKGTSVVDDDTLELYFSEDVKYDTIDKDHAENDYNITETGAFSNSASEYNTTQFNAHLNYQIITLGADATKFDPQPIYHHNFDNNYTKINIFGTIEKNETVMTQSIIGASIKDNANIPPKEFNKSLILRFDIPLTTGQTIGYEDYDGHIMDDSNYTIAGKARSYTDDNTSEIVTDDATGLVWQDSTEVDDDNKTLQEALSYCDSLDHANKQDWRLPTIEELLTLPLKEGDTLSSEFDNGTSGEFWSSTNYQKVEHNYWTINMSDGADGNDNEESEHKVRCVRGPE